MPFKETLPLRYFAYGSNMLSARFKQRVPSGRFVATAFINAYDLRFHMLCSDGSGKCDAFYTGRTSDCVYGVVYEMDAGDKPALDVYESLGEEYRVIETEVNRRKPESGLIPVFMYTALSQTHDSMAIPYDWYKEIVVKGAREHRLPPSYIKKLENVPVKSDPDTERSRKIRRGLIAE